VLRSLLDRGAIGLITTHDLALTVIATDLAPRAVNVHFVDWFEGGEIRLPDEAKARHQERRHRADAGRWTGRLV
jgi:ethanolamine utilization microcompartment shell protein EutS